MIIWILAILGLILSLPNSSSISPAIWIHGSAILLIIFMIKRFGYQILSVISLHSVKWRWLIISALVAIIYWFLDHWLMINVFKSDASSSIESWKTANKQYHIISVFVSSVVLAPIFEELFFRGLIFNQLSKRINLWIAAGVSALLFALIHWSWPEFISLFLAAMIYAYLCNKSNSLIAPLVSHIGHNLITFIYYFY